MPALIMWLILHYGWRNTAIIAGVALWVVGIPAALLLRKTPEQYGLLPDGALSEEELGEEDRAKGKGKAAEVNLTVRQALKSANFWILILGQVISSVTGSVVVMHQTVHLIDIGIPKQTAGNVLSYMVGVSIFGRIVAGWLGDMVDKRRLIFAFMIMQCIGVYILSRANTLSLVYLFVLIYGFAYGGNIPITSALRGDLFGRTNFASIQGMMSPIMMPFGMIGPVFAGWVYDYFGSYQIAFYAWIAGALVGAISYQFLRIPKPEVVPMPGVTPQPSSGEQS
jgi:sugar phosphate permease